MLDNHRKIPNGQFNRRKKKLIYANTKKRFSFDIYFCSIFTISHSQVFYSKKIPRLTNIQNIFRLIFHLIKPIMKSNIDTDVNQK